MIECYYTACPHHCCHIEKDEGPFCYERTCKMNEKQLEDFEKIRQIYLAALKKQLDTYDDFVVEQKRIWFGQLAYWRFKRYLKSLFGMKNE